MIFYGYSTNKGQLEMNKPWKGRRTEKKMSLVIVIFIVDNPLNSDF